MSHWAIFSLKRNAFFISKEFIFRTSLGLEWEIVDYSIYGDGFSTQVRVEVLLV